jgi:hypothetical protein
LTLDPAGQLGQLLPEALQRFVAPAQLAQQQLARRLDVQNPVIYASASFALQCHPGLPDFSW